MSNIDYATIHANAVKAAQEATEKHLRENPGFDLCGFSWVVIKPARGGLVSYLKKIGVGSTCYSGGWQIWNPSENMTQNCTAKEKGAYAYVASVKAALPELKIYAESRLD